MSETAEKILEFYKSVLSKDLGNEAADLHSKEEIHIKGAEANNLKNVEVRIPKNKLVLVTGLSGSGKSSLIMDTLFAEGQRRYVESLSSYARQFLERMKKPEVDFIKGICPAIAIEQRKRSSNARSTVGSLTEIYDYLRLLYAKIGKMYSPISGKVVKKDEVSDVLDYVSSLASDDKVELLAPFVYEKNEVKLSKFLTLILKKGYTKINLEGERYDVQDLLESEDKRLEKPLSGIDKSTSAIVVDRWVNRLDKDLENRITDSIQTAFTESSGTAIVSVLDGEEKEFNNRFSLDGREFPELSPNLFNFNNPYGACRECEGYGRVIGVSEEKVVPDISLSVYEGAVKPWQGEKLSRWKDRFILKSGELDFPIHSPYEELSEEEKNLLWQGKGKIKGIYQFFDTLEQKSYKIQNRILLSRYRGRTKCHVCQGYRLREEALFVKIGGKHISELTQLPIDKLLDFIKNLSLSKEEEKIASRLLEELLLRLETLQNIGLSYLTLDRLGGTLSGGEIQRIHLTRILGSNLTQSLYILDEPTIGLHPRDTAQVVAALKELRDLGNTVVVIEHEEDVIKEADYLIELGPEAGVGGGEIVYSGSMHNFKRRKKLDTYTLKYMHDQQSIPLPEKRRESSLFIKIKAAAQHNLKNVDVSIPLDALTVVSGVSGSGKSTLVKHILVPYLLRTINKDFSYKLGAVKEVSGSISELDAVEYIDQNPLGRSSRSNPITYIKAYDGIRKLMASQQSAKILGLTPGHFSFNTDKGRCPNCEGDGYVTIEMQFLADILLLCEECNGKRFKDNILDVVYKGKNIYDILQLSVDEAIAHFEEEESICKKLRALADVGLGYIALGQASNTLSGGEAQRVKLASFLVNRMRDKHTFFIFDEPTTGLHAHDVNVLLNAFQVLIDQGNTILVIEHNMDVIKCADWLIDLGPGGGSHGGEVLYQGKPEGLLAVKNSHTATFLKEKLEG